MIDKLIIALIAPLGTALALGGLALLASLLGRRHMAKFAGGLALAWLALWSVPVVSHTVRASLESAAPPVPVVAIPRAEAIVVLGGAIMPAERPGAFPDLTAAADRIWHAARLYRAGKAPIIVASGDSGAECVMSEAAAMRAFLLDLGVPDAAIVLEERSHNTRENAAFSAALLKARGVSRILLVTSALHMPRARGLFAGTGLEVLPAPADHESRQRFELVDWLPSAAALDGSGRAIKEVVARWSGR